MRNYRYLPTLEYTKELYEDIVDDRVYLIGVQHLAFTTVDLIKALITKGMNSRHIFLLGKCYSANPLAIEELRSMGVTVSTKSTDFNSHEPYDDFFKRCASEFVKDIFDKISPSKHDKIILLDDGGTLLTEALTHAKNQSRICGIEQTSSGYEIAKSIAHKMPIINVAKSQAKREFETPFISRMVSYKALEHIRLLDEDISKILIVGGGPIGKSISNLLENEYDVKIYDRDTTLSDLDTSTLNSTLNQFDLVIGCTGKTSLTYKQISTLNSKLILMSASSSDREFEAYKFRKELPVYRTCHQTVTVNNITLVNSGFPVNFDEFYLDSKEFQLTRSLLFSAVFQACSLLEQSKPLNGFHNLWFQNEILDHYNLTSYKTAQENEVYKSPEEFHTLVPAFV